MHGKYSPHEQFVLELTWGNSLWQYGQEKISRGKDKSEVYTFHAQMLYNNNMHKKTVCSCSCRSAELFHAAQAGAFGFQRQNCYNPLHGRFGKS